MKESPCTLRLSASMDAIRVEIDGGVDGSIMGCSIASVSMVVWGCGCLQHGVCEGGCVRVCDDGDDGRVLLFPVLGFHQPWFIKWL